MIIVGNYIAIKDYQRLSYKISEGNKYYYGQMVFFLVITFSTHASVSGPQYFEDTTTTNVIPWKLKN